MKIIHTLGRAAAIIAVLLTIPFAAHAELKANSADIHLGINVPNMNLQINPGGKGCKADEEWDTSSGGCASKNTYTINITAPKTYMLLLMDDSVVLTAQLINQKGAPAAAGIPVMWKTDVGVLSETSTVTDADGKAKVVVVPSKPEIYPSSGNVTATTIGYSKSVQVRTYQSQNVQLLTATPRYQKADGAAPVQLYATIKDGLGRRVPAGYEVEWTTDRGTLEKALTYTNDNGEVFNSIVSNSIGKANVKALSRGYQMIDVIFEAP